MNSDYNPSRLQALRLFCWSNKTSNSEAKSYIAKRKNGRHLMRVRGAIVARRDWSCGDPHRTRYNREFVDAAMVVLISSAAAT